MPKRISESWPEYRVRKREYHLQKGARYREKHRLALATKQRAYVARNPEAKRLANERYRRLNQDKNWKAQAAWRRRLKEEVMAYYGGVCQCCGEMWLEFLTIDHIDGSGREHRRQLKGKHGSSFYSWLKSNNFPSGYRVLCFNCNCALGFFGFCPHELMREELNVA